jgi:hypothetical protein
MALVCPENQASMEKTGRMGKMEVPGKMAKT